MKTKFTILFLIIGLTSYISQAQITDTVLTVSQNPFAISTDLTIHDLTNDTVSLKILTITGQVIEEYFENIVLTGTFTVTFNADTLSDGIYFVNLKQNGENHNLKLVKNQSSSISEITNNNGLEIYPNPTTDFLNISSDFKVERLEVYDINGRMKLKVENKQFEKVNLQNLKEGTYLLYLKTNEKIFVKKVIKN